MDIGARDLASAIGGRVPEAVVTFEPREEALGAWQEVKGEAMSVKGTVRRCDRGAVPRKLDFGCGCDAGNEVSSCVGGVRTASKCLCVFWPSALALSGRHLTSQNCFFDG